MAKKMNKINGEVPRFVSWPSQSHPTATFKKKNKSSGMTDRFLPLGISPTLGSSNNEFLPQLSDSFIDNRKKGIKLTPNPKKITKEFGHPLTPSTMTTKKKVVKRWPAIHQSGRIHLPNHPGSSKEPKTAKRS